MCNMSNGVPVARTGAAKLRKVGPRANVPENGTEKSLWRWINNSTEHQELRFFASKMFGWCQ